METSKIIAMIRERGHYWTVTDDLAVVAYEELMALLAVLEAASRDDIDRAFLIGRNGGDRRRADAVDDVGPTLPGL